MTGPGELREAPAWIPDEFSPEIVSAKMLARLPCLAQLTIVRAQGLKTVLRQRLFLKLLAAQLERTPAPRKVVFVFDAGSRGAEAGRLLEVLRFFAHHASDVEFVRGVCEAEFALNEAVAKIWADPQKKIAGQDDDPLGKVRSVIAATKDLRLASGRLSARKVGDAFGLSLNEMASILGTTRQALFKTPDSKAIQKSLFGFERVARLRTLLAPEEFGAWLNMSNEPLDGHAPLELIRQGQVVAVANLAEDMLTGSPA